LIVRERPVQEFSHGAQTSAEAGGAAGIGRRQIRPRAHRRRVHGVARRKAHRGDRFAEIAKRAGVSLSDLRDAFGSTLAILAAYMKAVDRAVLAGGDADMAEAAARAAVRRADAPARNAGAAQGPRCARSCARPGATRHWRSA
jgi:hypothetical protein